MVCSSCNASLVQGSLFCNQCGTRVEIINNEQSKTPKMLTVKQALGEDFFQGTISQNFLYTAIRNKKIPSVSIMGRILLDRNELIKWWEEQLEQSKKPITGLRKIK